LLYSPLESFEDLWLQDYFLHSLVLPSYKQELHVNLSPWTTSNLIYSHAQILHLIPFY
jgi:hypothetical protein